MFISACLLLCEKNRGASGERADVASNPLLLSTFVLERGTSPCCYRLRHAKPKSHEHDVAVRFSAWVACIAPGAMKTPSVCSLPPSLPAAPCGKRPQGRKMLMMNPRADIVSKLRYSMPGTVTPGWRAAVRHVAIANNTRKSNHTSPVAVRLNANVARSAPGTIRGAKLLQLPPPPAAPCALCEKSLLDPGSQCDVARKPLSPPHSPERGASPCCDRPCHHANANSSHTRTTTMADFVLSALGPYRCRGQNAPSFCIPAAAGCGKTAAAGSAKCFGR